MDKLQVGTMVLSMQVSRRLVTHYAIGSFKRLVIFFIFFVTISKWSLLLFFFGSAWNVCGQVHHLSSTAKLDTLVELTEIGYCKSGFGTYKYKFYKGNLYVLAYREEKSRQLYLHVYDAKTLSYVNGYLINHGLAGDVPVDFDINKDYLVISGHHSRLMYKRSGIEFLLLWKDIFGITVNQSLYQHAGLLNDSTVAFVRDYPFLNLPANEMLEVLICSTNNGAVINRVYLPADVPELGFVKNSHRVTFCNGRIIVGNYNKIELFVLKSPYQVFEVVKQLVIPTCPPLLKKIAAAKAAAIKQQSMEPLNRLFGSDFLNAVTVLCDVHTWSDSAIMTRVICPRRENPTVINNRVDFWRIKGTSMEHIASFSDWDNVHSATASDWARMGFSTSYTPYTIYGKKIFFFSSKLIEEGKAAREVQMVSVFWLDVPD